MSTNGIKDLRKGFNYIKSLFEQADDILKNSLSKMILEGPKDLLDHTENTQPAIFIQSLIHAHILKTNNCMYQ